MARTAPWLYLSAILDPRKFRTMVSPPRPRKTRPKAAAPHRIMKTMQVNRYGGVHDLAQNGQVEFFVGDG